MLLPRGIFPISALCDPSNSRYTLGGVHLERDKANNSFAVATDGRAMIACQFREHNWKDYPCVGFDPKQVPEFQTCIMKKDWDAAGKLPPAKSPKPILCNVFVEEPTANGKVTIGATDLETTTKRSVAVPEGRYPKWRDVIPHYQDHECLHYCVDPVYLAKLAKILSQMTDDCKQSITLRIPMDGNKPMLMEAVCSQIKTQAVLMPMSSDKDISRKDAVKGLMEEIEGLDVELLMEIAVNVMSPFQIHVLTERLKAYKSPTGLAALPEEWVAGPDTLENVMLFDEFPSFGWTVKRTAEGFAATSPVEVKPGQCGAKCQIHRYNPAGILIGTDEAVVDDDADVAKGADHADDPPEEDGEADDEDEPLDYAGIYDGRGHFDPEAFMHLTFGTGRQVEGYTYDNLSDVFEACRVKDREALAAWLMEEEPDRCEEIEEALCGAFPVGPEPANVA